MLWFLIFIIILSFACMVVIVGRNLEVVQGLNEEEFAARYDKSRPLTLTFHDRIIVPFLGIWHNHIVVGFFKKLDFVVGKMRTGLKHFEGKLSKINDYLHGRVIKESNKKSEYWSSMNEFKNELNEEE